MSQVAGVGETRNPRCNTVADFWAQVDKTAGTDACWPWLGCRRPDGYGVISIAGKLHRAHRLAATLAHGPSPLYVLHSCDNPSCCNPSHLSFGDQARNMGDCAARGRAARGSRHGHAKLTNQTAGQVRSALAAGEKQAVIAARFGISQTTVSAIKNGQRWRAA